MMMASATPTGTTSDVSPFPRGFAWRSASPTAMELTDHLRQPDSRPESTSDASPTATKASTSMSSRPNMTASSTITLAMLRPHFEEPLAQVAQSFGICVTLLKKICRRHGIARWPHRQISGLRKSIASMEHAIGYFEGERRESYAAQLNKQRVKLELLLRDPTSPSLLSPSSQAAAATASTVSSISASKFDEEDEDERSSMGSPNGVGFMYDSYAPASSVSPTAYARAYYPERHSLPEAFAFHSSPGRYEAPQTPTLPPLQGVLHPEHFHYQQQQQQQFEYEQGLYHHHEQQSAFPAAHHAPAIPPLRSEPKPLLPPISSLVVPASGGRASW